MKTMLDKGSTLNLPKFDFCVFFINQVTWNSDSKFCWSCIIIWNGEFFLRFFINFYIYI